MPKRRSLVTADERYKDKAFAIAKALGVSDDLAKAKAEKQYAAWTAGRTPYASISKKVRVQLRAYPDIPTTLYGTIIACANWVYRMVRKEKIMTTDKAVEEGIKRFGIDKALPPELANSVKNIITMVVTTT